MINNQRLSGSRWVLLLVIALGVSIIGNLVQFTSMNALPLSSRTLPKDVYSSTKMGTLFTIPEGMSVSEGADGIVLKADDTSPWSVQISASEDSSTDFATWMSLQNDSYVPVLHVSDADILVAKKVLVDIADGQNVYELQPVGIRVIGGKVVTVTDRMTTDPQLSLRVSPEFMTVFNSLSGR